MNIGFGRRSLWLKTAVAAALVLGSVPTLFAQPGEAPGPTSGELKNVAVLAGAHWEKLVADVSFLGSLGGKPEAGQMMEGAFSFFTQGKGPNAIDKTQPFGIIVQTDGVKFIYVACLPVTKPNDLLDVAKGYGAQIKDADNGAQEIMLQNKRSIYLKQENGMAYVSDSAASLAKLPPNPQGILANLIGDYDIAAHISVKNVPEGYRQFALQALQAGTQQGMKKKPDESDEEFAQRQKMTAMQMEQMKRAINETDNIKFGWAVDSKQQRTYADVSTVFVAGSKMAEQMAAYAKHNTNFAGFYQPDAASTATVASQTDKPLSAEDAAQTVATIQSARDQMNAAIDKKVDDVEARDAIKTALGEWLDAISETAQSGQIDGGGALHLSADSLTLIAGVHLKDTAKIESGLKKLEAIAKKQPDFPGVKWNAANHAGVTFHTITVPVPESEKGPRQLLGSELNVAVGIGPEMAYLAVGKDSMEAVTKAIDASATEKGKAVPPFEFALSLGPIMEAAAAQAQDGPQKDIVQKVADYLHSDAQGRDHIRAVGKMVPNGVEYHFEAEEGVLQAIGKASAAAQQRKMQPRR